MPEYFGDVVNPLRAREVAERCCADVERACASVFAILEMTAVVLAMRDSDRSDMPLLYRITKQIR